MSSAAGTWTVKVDTPMGPQTGTLTVVPEGSAWTGALTGTLGSLPVQDGKLSGDTLYWKLGLTSPMPLQLDCTATVAGDSLTGTFSAGMFGDLKLTGTRAG